MRQLLWTPKEEFIKSTNIYHFTNWLSEKTGINFPGYNDVHLWSINNIEKFWEFILEYSSIIYCGKYNSVLSSHKMPGAEWFGGIKLNYAENILEKNYNGTAIKYITENHDSKLEKEISFHELKIDVKYCAAALKKIGIKKGDRVAGYISNVPEAVTACLACAAIGAVWSSTSPDFGLKALVDRLSQVEPKVVFASSKYIYNGKIHSTEDVLTQLKSRIPSIEKIITIPFVSENRTGNKIDVEWNDFIITGKIDAEFEYEYVDFNSPLFIMFSSGTTGVPKCIVHGTGGTLLQHKKEHILHCNIKPADKLLYFTTTGWMMWNWQLSALASGAAIYLYEGSPAYPDLFSIWETVSENKITHFGTSGRYIESCMKSGLRNEQLSELEFDKLQSVLYTGSPLSGMGYEWIYNSIKKYLHLAGISGGTDIISCFVLGNPALPVYKGRIQCKGLGVDVCAFDEEGREIINVPGELVCRVPMPSMPVKFLNDPGGKKYYKSYFENFKGVWTHGDYIEFDENGSSVIYGRSDATLNPGGVRIGCAEIYSSLDEFDYIKGAVAAGWIPPGQSDEIIILFVVLNNNVKLDEKNIGEIKSEILEKKSPRHVPKHIFELSSLPVTRSGKPVELSVKAVLAGKDAANKNVLENPEILKEVELHRQKLLELYN